jgi:hypothetical protein
MDVLTCSICVLAAASGASLAGYVVGRRRRGGATGVMRSWPGPARGAPGRRRRTRDPDGRGGPTGGGAGSVGRGPSGSDPGGTSSGGTGCDRRKR